jgi:PTS system nitrogen regulatory IIA component
MSSSTSSAFLAPFCHPDWMIADLAARDRDGALAEIVSHLVAHGALADADAVLTALRQREELGSTAGLLGKGIANPHGRLAGLPQIVLTVARSRAGVEFGGDGPVHLIVVLLAPAEARGEYLQALAAVARWLKDERRRRAILGAAGPSEICQTLVEVEA